MLDGVKPAHAWAYGATDNTKLDIMASGTDQVLYEPGTRSGKHEWQGRLTAPARGLSVPQATPLECCRPDTKNALVVRKAGEHSSFLWSPAPLQQLPEFFQIRSHQRYVLLQPMLRHRRRPEQGE